ncbi:hypothetical protein IQ31_00096 [Sphingobacterium siyangense]|uniref:Uncharacterized protein n=1 Tax=Sphingobacterium siyangense TaxID=459529 RepID=A0A562N116_9SPHI|nr:hypothetical protein IQ31_00096 [Sphingobacterium siyangense]
MIREILIRKDSVSMLVYIAKCFRIEKVWIVKWVCGNRRGMDFNKFIWRFLI